MIRKINLKYEDEDFKAILYKNRREKLCEIPNDYISEVKRSIEDIDSFSISIPKYIQKGVKKLINPIYMKIKARQHIVVETKLDGKPIKEKFIIKESKKKSSKNSGEKSFVAESFETTLKGKRTSFDGKVIQLKKDEVHIAEGILDKFARETGWGIGYVDPKSRTETMSTTEKINIDIFQNYSKNNITDGSLIFDKDVITTIEADRPLYVSFEYTNFKTYNGNKLLIETPAIYNTITDPLHLNIKKIQAYHYSEVGNRYGIRYVFTLVDNTTVERIAVFTNIINKSITCENIRFVWETGNVISTENVKYINIESLDNDWYEALRSLQDNFNSVFTFDSYNKLINVIHRDNLGSLKPYILNYDNAIIDIETTEESKYITGYKVMGKDGLSIVSENIYGDDIVRNYSEYIRLGLMSDELQEALKRYESLLETKQLEWSNIKDRMMEENQRQVRINSEIKTLEERIKNLKNLLAGYMSANDSSNQARIKDEIDGLEIRLNECLALYTQYKINIVSMNDELALITSEIDKRNAIDVKGKIFTDTDLQELNDIEYIEEYEDDYYTNSFSLYNIAKKSLAEDIKPQIDFSINCVNLCKVIQNPKGWNYILQLGSLFKIDDKSILEDIGEDTVRFVEYVYEPKTKTIKNLVFTNKTKKINNKKALANLGKKTNTTNSLLNSLRPIIDDAKLSNNFAKEILDNGLDLSAYIARGRGISNYIDISEAGIYLYDQSDMNKAVYIGSSLICISTDGFKTSETAISSEGIFAKLLVGSVILGNKLMITSEDGSFTIGDTKENDGFGLEIRDGGSGYGQKRIFLGTEIDTDGVRRARLRLFSKDGREVVLDENGIISQSQFVVWDNLTKNKPMKIPYRSDDGVFSNKRILLSLYLDKYRAFERGMSSGGSITTSSPSSKTSSGASSSYSSGSSSITTSGASSISVTENAERSTFYTQTSATNAVNDVENGLSTLHSHPYFYNTEPHTHNMPHTHYMNHTHSIEHNHNIEHTHTLNTEHSHTLDYGIFEQESLCSNVKVYVNDILIRSGINSDTEIDITNNIKINQRNDIRIETDTNGRVTVNFFSKVFVGW